MSGLANVLVRSKKTLQGCLAVVALLAAASASAMQALNDEQLSGVEGEGLAIVLENISAQMGPQSYIRQVGAAPTGGTTLQQGDLYWFGWSITGDGSSGTQWAPSQSGAAQACSTAGVAGNLGCSIGTNVIQNMAAFDNPFVLRVFPYTAPDVNNSTATNTVMEFIAPSCVGTASSATVAPALGCATATQLPSDTYRWSFWGAIVVTTVSGAVASSNGMLQDQVIIEGVPAAYLYPPMAATTSGTASAPNMYQGAVLRMFRTVPDTALPGSVDDQTLGLNYASELSGNFRFSVGVTTAQTACTGTGGTCTQANVGTVPVFDNNEGMFFRNVQAFIPMGQLNYQSLVVSPAGTVAAPNGNFILELTRLPNQATAYNDFYSLESGDTTGYQTAHDAQCAVGVGPACGATAGTGNWAAVSARYFETHGYVQWGSGVPGTYTRPYATNNFQGGGNNDQGDYGVRPYAPSSACSGANALTAGCYTDTTDGISFVAANTQTFTAAASTSDPTCGSGGVTCNTSYTGTYSQVNLGTANIQGLAIQHLKITTLGAN